MRQISDNFNPFADSRRIKAEVQFDVIDRNAEYAEGHSSAEASISHLSQIVDKSTSPTRKIPALELNAWILDGTCELPIDYSSSQEVGFWSAGLSNNNAEFQSNPYIFFTFDGKLVTTYGITFDFDGKLDSYPAQIEIISYADEEAETELTDEIFDVDGAHFVAQFHSQNYKALRVLFLATKAPSQRARLVEITFGIYEKFTSDEICELQTVSGAAIDASSLVSKELRMTFDNFDKRYDILSPEGIWVYLQDGQKIRADIFVDGEKVLVGSYYFTEIKSTGGSATASIVANDKMLKLDSIVFDGGEAGQDTLDNIVSVILDGLEIQTRFENGLGDVVLRKGIPKGTSVREALQMLCVAAMCTCWIDADDILCFSRISIGASVCNITADDFESYDNVSITEKIGYVQLDVVNDFDHFEQTYISGLWSSNYKGVTVNNPCVYINGADVANWILACYNKRRKYNVLTRGNPALEIGDTVNIEDSYGRSYPAVIAGQTLQYDGGLSINVEAIGG